MFTLTECPRDAMQGIKTFIPTSEKVHYLQLLLKVGFDILDAGSFVSPKAIPQMADTPDVFNALDTSSTKTKLLAIVANQRGAEQAVQFDKIDYLGYPFSVSDTFQRKNTNAGIDESWARVEEIIGIAEQGKKELRVYLSMAFGNPYGDFWNEDVVLEIAHKLHRMGVKDLSLADTTGISTTEGIVSLGKSFQKEFSDLRLSMHLHAYPQDVKPKTLAVLNSGIAGMDMAMKGFGGCPMADDHLTGNMDSVVVLDTLRSNGLGESIHMDALLDAESYATQLFSKFA